LPSSPVSEMGLTTKPLNAETWPDFARLVEQHNGVWGGCWCLGFHEDGAPNINTPQRRRVLKETRVREGRAHAALVYDGASCVGWCQFGPTDELPRIKFRKAYNENLQEPPQWRITCFFVSRTHRHRGVAEVALVGALDQIAQLGGGLVESYPEDTTGRKVSGSFLNNLTVKIFERHGFQRERQIAKHHWVVTRRVG
jgi:GNAT superfamily N-acetyltransferase